MKIITLIIFLFLSNNASSIEVNFHAWGGSNNINDYIGNLREDLVDYGIDLKHTKISDTESSVNLILSESINQKSKVDLIWINGENFQKLKLNNLLYGPINDLNNLKFINLEGVSSSRFINFKLLRSLIGPYSKLLSFNF